MVYILDGKPLDVVCTWHLFLEVFVPWLKPLSSLGLLVEPYLVESFLS